MPKRTVSNESNRNVKVKTTVWWNFFSKFDFYWWLFFFSLPWSQKMYYHIRINSAKDSPKNVWIQTFTGLIGINRLKIFWRKRLLICFNNRHSKIEWIMGNVFVFDTCCDFGSWPQFHSAVRDRNHWLNAENEYLCNGPNDDKNNNIAVQIKNKHVVWERERESDAQCTEEQISP